jgi:cysteine desulfurase / selenocysteine lyase
MNTNDSYQTVPGPEEAYGRVPRPDEMWISERMLDPAVLARMANEFFTALPESAQPTDLNSIVPLQDPKLPANSASPASVSQTAQIPTAARASVPTEGDLRALPELLGGLTSLAPSATEVDSLSWGSFASGDLSRSQTFSFLEEARPIFRSATSIATLFSGPVADIPNVASAISAGNVAQAPLVSGESVRPEATERASSYTFLNEARQLFPSSAPAFAEGSTPKAWPDLGLSSRSFEVGEVRRDFPILQERVNGRPLIWFDNAATTQKPRAVIDRLSDFYALENSNIHRAAHELAARATDAYEGARERVRRFLNASSPREIIFVRGATEGINLVAQSWGRQNIRKDDEIVLTWLEHHANIVPWQMLCAEKGARLRVAPVDDTGQVLLDEYAKLVGPRTRLVSIAHVSNALGTVIPAREMIDVAHRYGVKVLLDGAQAVSHMPVDVQLLDCDFYVFSGHKVFAPTGIGAVYGKSAILEHTPPWQGGGSMILDVTFEKTVYNTPPARFEAGTGSIADAVGLGAAIDYVQRIGMANIARYEHDLLVYATEALRAIPGLRLIGTAKEKASVLSFVLDGFRTEDIGAALNREGIAVRAGHHCAQPIHRRFGLESTVRASLALYNTSEEIDALVAALWSLKQGHRTGF